MLPAGHVHADGIDLHFYEFSHPEFEPILSSGFSETVRVAGDPARLNFDGDRFPERAAKQASARSYRRALAGLPGVLCVALLDRPRGAGRQRCLRIYVDAPAGPAG